MCLQSAVIFFAFKNITLLKIFGKFDVTNVCSLFLANSVLYSSLIHSFIGYLRISFLGWGLLSARLQGQIHQGQPAVASVEKRDRGCFSNTRKHRGQNWLISSAPRTWLNVCHAILFHSTSSEIFYTLFCLAPRLSRWRLNVFCKFFAGSRNSKNTFWWLSRKREKDYSVVNRAKLRKKLPSRALIDHGKERPLWKGGDY